MAPRRNAKQTDSAPIEKAAEASDASPPKRSKVVKSSAPKVVQKQERKQEMNQKEARLPRAAKSRKLDQQQQDQGASAESTTTAPANTGNSTVTAIVETIAEPVPKKVRGKSKTTVQSFAKLHEQQQATKGKRTGTNAVKSKTKNVDDKGTTGDAGSGDASVNAIVDTNVSADNSDDPAKSIAKKGTRTKSIAKKAGNVTESVEEAEIKPKGRTKKNVTVPKDTDAVETMSVKSKKNQKNIEEVTSKEMKVKTKSIKKDIEKNDVVETKKRTSVRTKAAARSIEENNVSKAEEISEGKKTKAATSKKVRVKVENVATETTENNVDEVEESKPIKGRSKKMNKESLVIASAPRKGRGKKEAAALTLINEEEKEVELESNNKVSENNSIQDITENNEEIETAQHSDNEAMKEGTDAESTKSDKDHNDEVVDEEEEEEKEEEAAAVENNTDSASINEDKK